MDRNIYLICYDVSDRIAQRKVHNFVKAHAIGGQKSFYECLMSQNELHALVNNIQKAMNYTTDRLHFFFNSIPGANRCISETQNRNPSGRF